MSLKRLTHPNTLFLLILLAYLIYGGAFIFRTSTVVEESSFVPETKRYYVLFDDAMISLTYARNFANGDGLVWWPDGPRVEGYTNPVWVLYMAFWHWIAIADASKMSAVIQISGLVLLALNLVVVKKIAQRLSDSPLVMLGSVAFTAFYLPLNVWSLHGTEVSILTLFVSLALWWVLKMLAEDRFIIWPYVLLAFSTSIRIDMAVPLLGIAGYMVLNDRARWRQHMVIPVALMLAFMAPQFAFRKWYYDDWLPNTYYLKMNGYPLVKRLTQGYEVTGRFFMKVGFLPFAILIFRRDRAIRLVTWVFVGQVLYSMYVGGDAWEWYGGANRYLAIAIPAFFVLLWLTLDAFYRWLMDASAALSATNPRFRLQPNAARIGLALAAFTLLVNANYTYGTDALKEWLLIDKSMFADEYNEKIQVSFLLEALTKPDATITISAAGVVPYFTPREFVDILGKNDTTIGRMDAVQDVLPEYVPGHMKWDYDYSVGELDPDVVFELWVHEEDAAIYLDNEYVRVWFPPAGRDVWMRTDSPNIYWDRIYGN
ncbi:MAG: hypothetical protein JXA10_02030 [Anaerolineae bacterium]|nr:hypothetical protein [Anaerolineae bacterium]